MSIDFLMVCVKSRKASRTFAFSYGDNELWSVFSMRAMMFANSLLVCFSKMTADNAADWSLRAFEDPGFSNTISSQPNKLMHDVNVAQ